MPFDGLPEGLLSDMAKLRIALDGVRSNWTSGELGGRSEADHCALGWLLVATDWDAREATRLALNYVYPALPEKARKPTERRLASIYQYNDAGSHKRMVKLFDAAVRLAERKVVLA